MHRTQLILICGVIGSLGCSAEKTDALDKPADRERTLRLGYFHGVRSSMLYRTYCSGGFDREGVNVELYSRYLASDTIIKIPEDRDAAAPLTAGRRYFGKFAGGDILDRVVRGEFDGGTAGESSFLSQVEKGAPIVAVAMLAHDRADKPAKAILLRSGFAARRPTDFQGRTLIVRRGGPGDGVFLREFLKTIGMLSDPSIKILDGVPEDEAERLLEEGTVDGGLYHFRAARRLVKKRHAATLYRRMDWVNSELSHVLLVVHRDVIEKRRGEIQKLIDAYVKRIAYEKALPADKVTRKGGKAWLMQRESMGMSLPQYDMPPRVRLDLLREMQRLLAAHGVVEGSRDIAPFIDNRFVEEAFRAVKEPTADSESVRDSTASIPRGTRSAWSE